MTCRTGCWRAMAVKRWKKFSSTLRAAAADNTRPRNEQSGHRSWFLAQPRRRDGAPLLVSAALVLAAHSRSRLLADGADADVGLFAALRVAKRRVLRARRRRVHRFRAAMGHPVPRPTRVFDLIP